MNNKRYTVITGSGSYIPTRKISNAYFESFEFFDQNGIRLTKTNAEIITQFEKITGIQERRYVDAAFVASDIGTFAAKEALVNSQTDFESLDCIIVAHNFGDVKQDGGRSELVPCLAARVKFKLGIANPNTVTYDLAFGCAGWLQGVIQAHEGIRSGLYSKVLVIGAETLSRICDPHDRDSMIYSDGAGAILLEAVESDHPIGILAHETRSYCHPNAFILRMQESFNPDFAKDKMFLKMDGRKLYEQVLKMVPPMMKDCLEKSGFHVNDIDKFLIHQANQKMDEAILCKTNELYNLPTESFARLPMTIGHLGNSSVATIPTLYHALITQQLPNQTIQSGNKLLFVSVGAGINMNAVSYIMP